jgi:hypothetical protein
VTWLKEGLQHFTMTVSSHVASQFPPPPLLLFSHIVVCLQMVPQLLACPTTCSAS